MLFVSCGIVLRSFFIRRRFRQQVEEQIAAGLLPPEALGSRRDFGEKPKLWDVSIKPDTLEESWDYFSVSIFVDILQLSVYCCVCTIVWLCVADSIFELF